MIGREAREQIQEAEGRLPDALVACVGGGSNAIGLFHAFVPDAERRALRRRGGGRRHRHRTGTRRRWRAGALGVLHGARSYVLCDDEGQIAEAHSISAGLDYPGVGPEHAFMKETGRAKYLSVTDDGGARRLPAPGAHRGDPVRARERARDRGAAQGRGDAARAARSSSSTSRDAATRTWGRSRRVSV